MVIGQAGHLFGELHCDIAGLSGEGLCPSGLSCVCDEQILVGNQTCESTQSDERGAAWVCRSDEGAIRLSMVERFKELLGEESLVSITTAVSPRYFIASYPEAQAQIRNAIDTLTASD